MKLKVCSSKSDNRARISIRKALKILSSEWTADFKEDKLYVDVIVDIDSNEIILKLP